MPWNSSPIVLRLLALLALSDLVRSGFLVAYLPLAGRQFELSAADVGLIVGLNYLADALAKGPVGVLTERFGLGRMAFLGAFVGIVTLLALPHVPFLFLAWLLSLTWGLAFTSLWPGVMTAVSHFAKEGKQSRALSWASVAAAPGIVLGVLGVGLVMKRAPELGYPILVGTQVVALLLALSLVNLRLPRRTQRTSSYRWVRVATLIPAAFAQTLAPGLLVPIFYPYLARLGLSVTDLLAPAALGAVVGLGCVQLAGRLADRLHPRAALLPGLLLLGTTFVLLGLPGAENRLYLITAVGGLAYALFLAGWNGLVGRTLPKEHRTAAWGTVMAVEALGYAVGPVLGGVMWERFGSGGPFYLGALVFLLVNLYYVMPWREAARRLSATPPR
ncbi:MFS transporter [Deinococcus pimensis]|uniref:MFS transporter n=1 Tax=Deinococcus pimensis TaxID=309888 RepID=UPI000487CE4A|nr:MFS transporter [Deinococcus pimensis]